MASDSPKPQRGLMAMSDQILLEICAKLCLPCSNIPIGFKQDISTQDLFSLGMTCRRLGAVVQQFIHRDASPKKMQQFLRTITENKHLAAKVHRFCNEGADPDRRRGDVHNYLNSPNVRSKLDNDISSHHQLLTKMLAELTNAKHLSINVPCRHGYQLDALPKISVLMASVTTLSLTPWVEFDLGQMGDFLAAMPCLERLTVTQCTLVTQQLPLARIRSLTFQLGLLGPKSLQNLVDSCPILEHLDLYFGGVHKWAKCESERLKWNQAQRILQSRKETLKHLRLQFDLMSDPTLEIEEVEYFGSFCGFDRLESLWVRTDDFASKDYYSGIPRFPESVQHLVSMLPGSLTCIYFSGRHGKWHGIQVLAQAIREGHFPRLERVVVEGCHPLITAVLPYYEELSATLGVCFEILSDGKMRTRWKQHITAAYPWEG